jgi:hypothetical protein
MRRATLRVGLNGALWAVFALGCDSAPELAGSPAGANHARDAWVERASPVGGDGATEFVSGVPRASTLHHPEVPFELPDPDMPGPAAVEGGRVYGLSAYSGLVITDAPEGGPTRVEGRYPLLAGPFDVSVQDGIVLALVNDALELDCPYSPVCQGGPTSGHVLLIDAREPSAPRLLAERYLRGAITHAHRIDDTLYIVSHELRPCGSPGEYCQGPEQSADTVTAIGLDDPLALADLGQLEFATADHFLFSGDRLFVETYPLELSRIELDRGLRPGPSVPIPDAAWRHSLAEEAGILRFETMSGARDLAFRVSGPGELVPIELAVMSDLEGNRLRNPLFHGGSAFGLSEDGLTLLAFDLTTREAPRLAGTLALPFPAIALTGTVFGQLVALGANTDYSGASGGPVHLMQVDVQDLAAPALLGELSWGQDSRYAGPVHYDAETGVLLAPYRVGAESSRVRVFTTAGGELALGADLENVYGYYRLNADPDFVIDGDRLVSMRQGRIVSYSIAGPASQTIIPLALPTDALRVLGERLVRVPGNALDVQLLELPIADPPIAEGTPLTGAFPPEWLTGWDPQVFQRGQHLYLTGGLGGARPELAVYGFDVSEPSRALPTGSVTLPGPDSEALQVVQTGSSLIVARSRSMPPATPDEPAPDKSLSYDIIDVSTPGAPRVATRFDVPAALATRGFAYWPDSTSIDTAWGWQHNSQGAPLVVDGDLLVTQHVQIIDASRRRFFLDRLDVSDPDEPVLLSPVNIPGSVLHFDRATGSLITIENLRFEERVDSYSECAQVDMGEYDHIKGRCAVTRRALAGLSLEGDRAIRRSQLLLDTSRNAISFAVSGNQVYYVTEPLLSEGQRAAAVDSDAADVLVTIERVRIDDGELTRLPSLDVTGLHPTLPRYWPTLLARGNRVIAATAHDVAVIDFGVDPPSVRTAALPAWGCQGIDIDVTGEQIYCARGAAGLDVIPVAP